jgi:hypothetical protein
VIELRGGTGRRKATGTFYTPRSITDYLVRRTLHPLVQDRTPDQVLALRVVDPAMGSGAFLVGACTYLAASYEAALVEAGACSASDITDHDRAGFRRTVAQRCLFGVDLNPMAVQLARLSLWLTTLSADRPLTFLDHHLRLGDSLVGASIDDLRFRAPGGRQARRPARGHALPLFPEAALGELVRGLYGPRQRIALDPGDTLDAVRAKERLLDRLERSSGDLARWKTAADLWCASWFRPEGMAVGEFAALCDHVMGRASPLGSPAAARRLEAHRSEAAEKKFFHWSLEFPEAFFAPDGSWLPDPGFDAVLGNPPWDMVRADAGTREARAAARPAALGLLRFVRGTGLYTSQSDGHANRYQLFVERALHLVRRGGRIGLVVPAGLAVDHGCERLRHRLLRHCRLDPVVGFDNRAGLFPIHRSVRFLVVSGTHGGSTSVLRCRFGEADPAVLDRVPADGTGDAAAFAITLTPALLARFSGPGLAIPDLRSPRDVEIIDQLTARFPPLGDATGWRARFGRELNATDDRESFEAPGAGLPVVEGKQVEPYRVTASRARYSIPRQTAQRLLRAAPFDRSRLAYRDVASPTNRRTLIAAVLPAGVVSTHTLFCLREPREPSVQWVLCGILNSYVANFLVRCRVSTHVTVSIVERLPAPALQASSGAFAAIEAGARRLAAVDDPSAHDADLQAAIARLYGLSAAQFDHILSTFPLVPVDHRQGASRAFRRLGTRAAGVWTDSGAAL